MFDELKEVKYFTEITDFKSLKRKTFEESSKSIGLFHRKKLTDVIIWEMHGFLHKFPTVRENATKPMVWGKSGGTDTHPFPIVWYFFPIRFPSYGILQHMRNVWVSP